MRSTTRVATFFTFDGYLSHEDQFLSGYSPTLFLSQNYVLRPRGTYRRDVAVWMRGVLYLGHTLFIELNRSHRPDSKQLVSIFSLVNERWLYSCERELLGDIAIFESRICCTNAPLSLSPCFLVQKLPGALVT